MIRYRLQCNKKHEFEAWFGSSSAYDRQAKRGLVECPDCGSNKVTKTLMAPGVATSEKRARGRDVVPVPASDPAQQEAPAAPPSPEAVAQIALQRFHTAASD